MMAAALPSCHLAAFDELAHCKPAGNRPSNLVSYFTTRSSPARELQTHLSPGFSEAPPCGSPTQAVVKRANDFELAFQNFRHGLKHSLRSVNLRTKSVWKRCLDSLSLESLQVDLETCFSQSPLNQEPKKANLSKRITRTRSYWKGQKRKIRN